MEAYCQKLKLELESQKQALADARRLAARLKGKFEKAAEAVISIDGCEGEQAWIEAHEQFLKLTHKHLEAIISCNRAESLVHVYEGGVATTGQFVDPDPLE